MTPHAFFLRISTALMGCQLVEQELKLYISEAFELIRRRIDGTITFTMSGEDYKNGALESLIKVFRKLSSNPELTARLDKFKDERNFLSHRGITYCLDREGELDLQQLAEFQGRLDEIAPEARKLCTAINLEANKFRGHLFFD